MLATLRKVSSTITLISDPIEIRAAINNELDLEDGRRKLVCKGIEMAKTVEYIYRAYADHTDLSGHPFQLSARLKGICHCDKWNNITKVSAYDYEQYLSHWMCFGSIVTSLDGSIVKLSAEAPALAISDKMPWFSVQIWCKARWLTPTIAGWFKWLEN